MEKKLFSLLTLIIGCCFIQISSAQVVLTVGEGTSTNEYIPIYGFYMDSYIHSQFVYPASLLGEMAGSEIEQVTFYATSPAVTWSSNVIVKVGICDNSTLSSFVTAPATTVYTGTLSVNANTMTIVFQNPFLYTEGNLLFDISSSTTGNYAATSFYGIASAGASVSGYNYNAGGTISATARNFLPKTSFTHTPTNTSCHSPFAIHVSNISGTDAQVTWTPSEDGNNYLFQYKTANESWDTAATLVTSDTNYDFIGQLTPATLYDVRVSTLCNNDTSQWRVASFRTTLMPEALPYTATFNENDSWLLNNGDMQNYWMKGTNDGTNALFITNNGATPGYNNNTSSGVSAEKHILVGDASSVTISFDLKCGGETNWDYMKLFLAPMSSEYPASSFPDWGSNNYSIYAANFSPFFSYTETPAAFPYVINLTENNTIHVDLVMNNPIQNPNESSLAKLVFGWKNDNSSGDMPGPVITNLHVAIPNCERPSAPTAFNIGPFSADISWTAPSEEANNFILQYVVEGMDWNTSAVISENVTGTSASLTGLTPNTNYRLRIATNCDGDTSLWRTIYFTTLPTCSSPENVTISQITGTSALLTWSSAYYGANSYTVMFTEAGQNNWVTKLANGTTLMLSNLTPNTNYNLIIFSNCELGTADTVQKEFTTHCLVGGNLTIGNGTNTTAYLPSYNLYNYSYTQQLFKAEEMGDARTLRSIAFNLSDPEIQRTFQIYLMHTSASNLSSPVSSSNAQLVYSGNNTMTSGWNTFNFTTPFNYNGTDNLLLVVIDATGSWESTKYWHCHTAFEGSVFFSYRDDSPYNISTVPTGTTSNSRNDVIFGCECDTTTTCVAPNVYVVETTSESITINWAIGYTENEWEMEYSTDNVNWTPLNTVTHPYTLTGLNPNTKYYIHLRSICDTNEYSDWTNLSARTECSEISSLPFAENFDSYGTGEVIYPYCWNKITTSSYSNTPFITSNPAFQTHSLYFYAFDNSYDIAITPVFDSSISLNALEATFMYSAAYNTDMLIVGVMTNPVDVNSFIPIDTVYPDVNPTNWIEREVNFSQYSGDAHYIAFKNESIYNYAYAYIDNLIIDSISYCVKPSDLIVSDIDTTFVTLSWTNGDEESNWDIEYGPAGFSHGSGTLVNATTNPFTLDNLISGYEYEVYVRAHCGLNDVSNWSLTPAFFTTSVCGSSDKCEYTFILGDNYGDGWNDAFVNIVQNNVTVATVTAINHQQSQTQTYDNIEIMLCDNMPTQLVWNSGNYDVECSLTLIGPDGIEIVSISSMADITTGFILHDFTSNCDGCNAPLNLTVQLSDDASSATITWEAGNTETNWVLEYQIAGEAWTTENISGTAIYTLNNLQSSSIYNVRVKTDCGDNYSGYRTVSFSTPCDIISIYPYIESFENGLGCWQDSAVIGNFNWTTATEYNSTSLLNGEHCVLVNSTQHGIISRLISPTFDLSNLSEPYIKFNHIQTLWVSDQDSLHVYYKTSPSAQPVLLTSYTDNITSWQTDSIALPNASSSYQIIFEAYLEYGYGVGLDMITVYEHNTLIQPTCDLPSNINTDNISQNTADVSWTAGGDETAWNLQYKTAADTEWGNSIAVNTIPTYHFTGLNAETTYHVRVQANCGDNTSDWTAPVSFTTLAIPVEICNTPIGLTITEITQNSAKMSWTAGGDEFVWKVGYKNVTANVWQEATVAATVYNIEGLSPETAYDVRVKAVCSATNESDFATENFTTTADAINDVSLANSINLMPNPADNYIELSINSSVEVTEAVVYNAFGQILQTILLTDNHARIDLGKMAAGMYFVRVNGENATATKKFIKK